MSCLDCNDCNQSPILPVNVILPGPAGQSAYVYVAFATTVNNVGNGPSNPNPSTSQLGFQNGYPQANSAFFAVLTSTTPIASPVASNFNGLWVPLAGVTLSGINLEQSNNLIAGGPFTTVNFQGTGLTGVTVTNDGGNQATVQITTAGLIKITWSSFQTLVTGNLLSPGASYWIVDAGDGEGSDSNTYKAECSSTYYANFGNPVNFAAYPHNTGIVVRALSTNTIASEALYLARVPNALWFMPGTNYAINAYVVSYNQVFQNTSGVIITGTVEPANDPTNWTYIPRDNNTYYSLEIHKCTVDITFLAGTNYPAIRQRWDNKGNDIKILSLTTDNEFIKKVFRWGVSTIINNTIHLYDDSSRRASNDTLRSPSFNEQLVNFSNIQVFEHNKVDTNLKPNPGSATIVSSGTRFFNVYFNGLGRFYGNVIDNSIISNITSNAGSEAQSYNIYNNIINSSILNNTKILSFYDNTITKNSVIGDMYYYNALNSTDSNYSLMFNLNFTSTQNFIIQNNLGSKTTTASGTQSDITSVVGGVEIALQNGLSNVSLPAGVATGDYVQFLGTNPVSLLNKYYVITVTGTNKFTIPDTSITPNNDITINCRFFKSSVETSIKDFYKNTFENSVFRRINKNANLGTLSSGSSNFSNNSVIISYIENDLYSDPDNELRGRIELNRFLHCIIWNNKFDTNSTFSDNQIEFATFSYNNNLVAGTNGGITNGGFYSLFRSNVIKGDNRFTTLISSSFSAWAWGNQSITFNQNVFNGAFEANSLYNECLIKRLIVNPNSFLSKCVFKGDNVTNGQQIFGVTKCVGLTDVTIDATSNLSFAVFEGKDAGLDSLTWTTKNESKQIWNYSNISSFVLRDQKLSGATKTTSPDYRKFLPGLVASQINPIRDIIIEGQTSIAYTPAGGGVYSRYKYTIIVTTQFPHMLSDAVVATGTKLYMSFASFNINGIDKTALLGKYVSYPTTTTIDTFATPTVINNEYTFKCEIEEFNVNGTGQTGIYFLGAAPPTNPATDGYGNGYPGAGLVGSYSDTGDPNGRISYGDWFKGRYDSIGSYTSYDTIIGPNYFNIATRISVKNSNTTPLNTPQGFSRFLYQFKDYLTSPTPAIKLYDSADKVLTIPHFFDQISSTIVLGSFGDTSTAIQIDQIRDMPELMPVRFVTMPYTKIQFNLVTAAAAPGIYPTIVKDSGATSVTITSYYDPPASGIGSYLIYDELILMRQGLFIKIIDKIIHQ